MTDAYLKAALEIGRALCVRTQRSKEQAVDFTVIDKAILDIEKRAQNLDQIRKSAETIQSSSETILDRVRIDQKGLVRQLGILRESIDDLKKLSDTEDATISPVAT